MSHLIAYSKAPNKHIIKIILGLLWKRTLRTSKQQMLMSWALPVTVSDLLQNSCIGTFKLPFFFFFPFSIASCLLPVGKWLSVLLACLAFSTVLHPHSLLKMAPTLEILRFSASVFHLYRIPQHSSCNSRSQLSLLSSCLLCCSHSFSLFSCPAVKHVGQFKLYHTPRMLKVKPISSNMQYWKEPTKRGKKKRTEKVNIG